MELRDLRAFVTLGEVLHFSQAANRLNLSQSALSKQIRRLELELGSELFERNASQTRLTDFGRELYKDACQLVLQSEQLTRNAKDIRAGLRGTLRIGFGVATKTLVPQAIAQFRQMKPGVKIELCDLSTHHQIMALREGTLDLGFCRLPAPKGWPALPVVKARFVAVLPAGYPEMKSLHDLIHKPLVIIRRDKAPSFYDHLMSYLAKAALRFEEIQYVTDFSAAVALAAAGVAWAIVPSSTVIEPHFVRPIPLDDPAAGWMIGLTRPPGQANQLVETFWSIVSATQC